MKACPLCAEQIQDAAVKCRFCGADLRAPPEPAMRPCPECAEQVPSNVATCPFCTARLGVESSGAAAAAPVPPAQGRVQTEPPAPRTGGGVSIARILIALLAVGIVVAVVGGVLVGGAGLVAMNAGGAKQSSATAGSSPAATTSAAAASDPAAEARRRADEEARRKEEARRAAEEARRAAEEEERRQKAAFCSDLKSGIHQYEVAEGGAAVLQCMHDSASIVSSYANASVVSCAGPEEFHIAVVYDIVWSGLLNQYRTKLKWEAKTEGTVMSTRMSVVKDEAMVEAQGGCADGVWVNQDFSQPIGE